MHRDSPWHRPFALALVAEQRLRDGYLGRTASFYGWGIALSYALLVLLAPGSAGALVTRALTTSLWLVGLLVALAALRDVLSRHAPDAVTVLAREAGFEPSELYAARALAVFRRLLKTVGAPMFALGLVALAAWLAEGKP